MLYNVNILNKRRNLLMDERIKRINELYKKSKEEGLSASELAEQKKLREEYARSFREGLKQTLSNVYIMDENGNEKKLERKKK